MKEAIEAIQSFDKASRLSDEQVDGLAKEVLSHCEKWPQGSEEWAYQFAKEASRRINALA